MGDPITTPKKATRRSRKPVIARTRPSDIDLTGGFRLDMKTIGLLLAMAGSWYTLTSKVDSIREKMDLQERARVEVESAKRETDEARRQQDASERKALSDALLELKGQLKLTALDVADLKIAVGPAKPRS